MVAELLTQKQQELDDLEAQKEEMQLLKLQCEVKNTRVRQLEEDVDAANTECSRLRTENVRLKNEMKVYLQDKQPVTNKTRTIESFSQDMADTINMLTTAIESVAGRLDAHDEILNQRQQSTKDVPVQRAEEGDIDVTRNGLQPGQQKQAAQTHPLTQQQQHQPRTTLEAMNKFSQLQFTANNPVITSQQVSNMVPGPRNYNDVVAKGPETLIFSTSITKGINNRDFNEHFEGEGSASFRRFHGGLARQIKEYLWVHLSEVRPESVIIQTGGNDLPTPRSNPVPVVDIASEIIQSGLICREYGSKNIFISGVPTRRAHYMQVRCRELNDILMEQCKAHGFIFIDNTNINTSHLQHDGVHLTNEGSVLLAKNYLFSLNSLAWSNIYSPQS